MLYKFFKMPLCHKVELLKKVLWFVSAKSYGRFGKYSIIDRPLIIYNKKNIYIGKGVKIRPNIRIEPVRQWDKQFFDPKIIIGDNTCIEQNCHIACANKVELGKNVTMSAYSFITDLDHEYYDVEKGILQQPLIVKETSVGDESFIGSGARILSGVKIGRHCIIGANAVVNRDIPDYSIAVGIPAKIIKRYNFNTNLWEKTNEYGDFLDK